jgi:hypothetical protein
MVNDGLTFYYYGSMLCTDDRPQLYPTVNLNPPFQTTFDNASGNVTFGVQTSDVLGISSTIVTWNGQVIDNESGPVNATYSVPNPNVPGTYYLTVSATDAYNE